MMVGQRLPPINTGQRSAPPGFTRPSVQEMLSEGPSPTGQMKTARTSLFPPVPQQDATHAWAE